MKTEHAEFLERLEAWSPDAPGTVFPFSQRLARDNAWSLHYARRVVREYKRFAFLAVAAGHPVTPSDQVDQAWHLHLLYTQSYWKEFCPEILRTSLHHGPTKGGTDERNKFNDWYARTLASYRGFFGEEPPSDIWPAPLQRFGDDIHFARVNTARNWVVPKPAWMRKAAYVLSAARRWIRSLLPRPWARTQFAGSHWFRVLALYRFSVAQICNLICNLPYRRFENRQRVGAFQGARNGRLRYDECRLAGQVPALNSPPESPEAVTPNGNPKPHCRLVTEAAALIAGWPFDLTAGPFLLFFIVTFALNTSFAAWLRWRARLPVGVPDEPVPQLDPTKRRLAGGPLLFHVEHPWPGVAEFFR